MAVPGWPFSISTGIKVTSARASQPGSCDQALTVSFTVTQFARESSGICHFRGSCTRENDLDPVYMEWGTPVQWGWFLLFSRSGGHKTKETYPTRPGFPTPCKQALNLINPRVQKYPSRTRFARVDVELCLFLGSNVRECNLFTKSFAQ